MFEMLPDEMSKKKNQIEILTFGIAKLKKKNKLLTKTYMLTMRMLTLLINTTLE